MCIVEKIREKRQRKTIMKDFVEGRMSCKKFWNFYLKDKKLQDFILKDKTRFKKCLIKYDEITIPYNPDDYAGEYALENYVNNKDINNFFDRLSIYKMVSYYFLRRKKHLNYNNPDEKLWEKIVDITPDYLVMVDSELFVKIYFEPTNVSDEARDKLYIKKLTKMFAYDNVPPEWIQNAEWPIIDGIPMTFKKQINSEKESESGYLMTVAKYYFYLPNKKYEKIVEQWDFL